MRLINITATAKVAMTPMVSGICSCDNAEQLASGAA